MIWGIILGGLAGWGGKSSPLYKRRAPFRNLAGSSLGRSSLSGSRPHHPDDRGGPGCREARHRALGQSLLAARRRPRRARRARRGAPPDRERVWLRSEEHTSELQSLMRISYAVFCLKKKNTLVIRGAPADDITHHDIPVRHMQSYA